MKDLLLIVPSRGRPGNVERLWNVMGDTCRADTTLLVGLDDDDPALTEYPDGPQYEVRGGLRQVVAWLNELAVPRTGEYGAIGTIGDDNVPLTDGWDNAILRALEDTPFAFGNDLYPRLPGTLACHVFVRSEIIEMLGYFGLPSLRHMTDLAWQAWGEAAGITYLPDVVIEHLHFTNKKSPVDDTYLEASAVGTEDMAAFIAYCRDPDGLNADVARIGGRQYTDESLRAFMKGLWIPW